MVQDILSQKYTLKALTLPNCRQSMRLAHIIYRTLSYRK